MGRTRVIWGRNLHISNSKAVTINNKCPYLQDPIEKDLLKIIKEERRFLIKDLANLIYLKTKF